MAGFGVLLAGVTAIAFLCRILWQIGSGVLTSPLRSVPGPPLAKITSLYISLIGLTGTRTPHVHSLHQKYGPIVRIGPNEISLSTTSSIRELYSSATSYAKDPIYESMTMKPLGLFSIIDHNEHKGRKKLFNHVFTQTNLQECQESILQHAEKLSEVIQQSLGEPLDAIFLFRMLNLDVSGELLLGNSFDSLGKSDPPQYVRDIYSMIIVVGLQAVCPFIHRFLSTIPAKSLQYILNAPNRITQHGAEALEKYIRRRGCMSNQKNLLTKVIAFNDCGDKDNGTIQTLSNAQLANEITNMVLAGTETTSMTFTYLFWELSRRKEWQKKLRNELQFHFPLSGAGEIAFRDLQNLPILDAVLTETFRVHPPLPGGLPRIVPEGGRELGGFWIPGGTKASMQCYTTHRDPSAFTNPDQWDPSRWLDGKEMTAMQKELFMPFSKGSRGCLGKNMALMVLKITTTILVTSFQVDVADTTQEDDMIMRDYFLATPKARKCNLIFNKL